MNSTACPAVEYSCLSHGSCQRRFLIFGIAPTHLGVQQSGFEQEAASVPPGKIHISCAIVQPFPVFVSWRQEQERNNKAKSQSRAPGSQRTNAVLWLFHIEPGDNWLPAHLISYQTQIGRNVLSSDPCGSSSISTRCSLEGWKTWQLVPIDAHSLFDVVRIL